MFVYAKEHSLQEKWMLSPDPESTFVKARDEELCPQKGCYISRGDYFIRHRYGHASRTRSSGFTLIELSIVVFLIGTLFFISMPKLGNFLFRTDLKDTVRSLKAAVNMLRTKSISTHRPTTLHLDLDQNLYWGAYTLQNDKEENPELKRVLVLPKKLPEGIRFLDAANINTPKRSLGLLSSTFNSKGALEETIIHLTDKNQNVVTVVVNAYTGRFLVFDEYVDVEYGEK
jgi:prepilin-type N-terminal cleavage/methylation domain-containing protein